MTRGQQFAYYRSTEAKRQRLYAYCRTQARKALNAQVAEAIQAVREGKALPLDTIHAQHAERALLGIYSKVVPVFALTTYKIFVKSDSHDWQEKKLLPGLSDVFTTSWIRQAQEYIRTRGAERVRKITETTRDKIKQFLSDALAKGWSNARTANELEAYTQAINKSRAVVIARTELVSASNLGSYFGATSTGLKLDKVWLATRDSRTRDPHRTANGQRVDINGLFEVGGEKLAYPGDSTHGASAKNVIQCRCTQVYKPKAP